MTQLSTGRRASSPARQSLHARRGAADLISQAAAQSTADVFGDMSLETGRHAVTPGRDFGGGLAAAERGATRIGLPGKIAPAAIVGVGSCLLGAVTVVTSPHPIGAVLCLGGMFGAGVMFSRWLRTLR